MLKKWMSGGLLITFMAVSAAMAAYDIPETIRETESPALETLLRGSWAPGFEKTLNDTLPVSDPSRDFWGRSEYALFGQGRKGVLVGADGWLFTDEEFSCPKGGHVRFQSNLSYIRETRDALAQRGIALAVILIPAKTRLYPTYLGRNKVPHCREDLYSVTLLRLRSDGLKVFDLLSKMSVSPDRSDLFLKTDTHWTPVGARLAAETAEKEFDTSGFAKKTYGTAVQGEGSVHEGDLLRYLPGVGVDDIPRDTLAAYVTEEKTDGEGDMAADLFGEDIPPVTLVGTSYSANPSWHFLGFLKEALGVDILDMSDEGRGPFTVMEKYLESDALKNTPPRLVIWEIPERYMMSDPALEKAPEEKTKEKEV